MSETKEWLRPGSDEAIEAGCICAILDNHHGRGIGGDGAKYGWYINYDCPIHGAEANSLRENEEQKRNALP